MIATISTTAKDISRTAEFRISLPTDSFSGKVVCGSLSTTLQGAAHTAVAEMSSSKKDNVLEIKGILDLDAVQTTANVPFKIFCALPVKSDAPVSVTRDVKFSIADATATAYTSILDNACAKSTLMKIPKSSKDKNITIKLDKTAAALNSVLMKVDADLVTISSAAPSDPCTVKVDGKDAGEARFTYVSASNGVNFALDQVAPADSKVEITCDRDAGLAFDKKARVPAVTSFLCASTADPETTNHTSYSIMNGASTATIVGASIATIAAALALFA